VLLNEALRAYNGQG